MRKCLVGLLALVLVGVGAWAAAARLESPYQVAARAEPPAPPPLTAAVRVGHLHGAISIAVTGEHQQVRSQNAPAALTGVVTAHTLAGGDLAVPGSAVMRVDGRPLFVLPGDFALYRDIQPGDRGDDVVAVQEGLRVAGFFTGRVDGHFGPRTQAAVAAMYRAAGQEVPRVEVELPPPLPASEPVEPALEPPAPEPPVPAPPSETSPDVESDETADMPPAGDTDSATMGDEQMVERAVFSPVDGRLSPAAVSLASLAMTEPVAPSSGGPGSGGAGEAARRTVPGGPTVLRREVLMMSGLPATVQSLAAVGTHLDESTPVLTVTVGDLVLATAVPSASVGALVVGAEATFTGDNDEVAAATVSAIDHDAETGEARIVLTAAGAVSAGVTYTVTIDNPAREEMTGLLVPVTAVVSRAGASLVYIASDDDTSFTEVAVAVDGQQGGVAAVTPLDPAAGLSAGVRVRIGSEPGVTDDEPVSE